MAGAGMYVGRYVQRVYILHLIPPTAEGMTSVRFSGEESLNNKRVVLEKRTSGEKLRSERLTIQ